VEVSHRLEPIGREPRQAAEDQRERGHGGSDPPDPLHERDDRERRGDQREQLQGQRHVSGTARGRGG
jgi:hypothetical protein